MDKDLSTHAVASTDSDTGWLKLEFHTSYFIHKVVIYYRFYTNWYRPNDGCVSSVDNFKKCVDNDNNVDVSVYQGEAVKKSCGTLQLAYGLEQSDQIYTLLCNTEGDVLKLSKSTGNIAVFEVVATSTGIGHRYHVIVQQVQLFWCDQAPSHLFTFLFSFCNIQRQERYNLEFQFLMEVTAFKGFLSFT